MPRNHWNILLSNLRRRLTTFLATALALLVIFASGLAVLPAAAEYVTPRQLELIAAATDHATPAPAEVGAATRARVEESFGKLPLQFEANRGQIDANVKFLARGRGYNLFLTPTEAVLALRKNASEEISGERETTPDVLRMSLLGANASPAVEGADALAGKSNYMVGSDPRRWRSNVETFARVKYTGVYEGIDLVYYGNQGQLEYDFLVAPGADVRAIRLSFTGADRIEIDERGDLVLHVSGEVVRQPKPVVYQQSGGARREVVGAYVVKGGREVSFEIGEYDARAPLVIDPVLIYSSYLGGSGAEQGYGVAYDAEGNIYVTGLTDSFDFPVTPGAFQTTRRPLTGTQIYYGDAFVMKLNPSGTQIVYATYIGGTVGGEIATGIDVDAAGNAYVTGNTGGGATASGYTNDFPTVNAFDSTPDSYDCPFVLKLNPTGSALVYSTYLGSGNANRLALNKATGEVYIIGGTYAVNFPTTPGALKTEIQNGEGDGFVTKLAASGSSLIYSTYLGGNGAGDSLGDIEIDSEGNAYIVGSTGSLHFPVTPNAAQPNCTRCEYRVADAFYVKLNPAGSQLLYSTFLGGSQSEGATGVAIDSARNVYVAGGTASGSQSIVPFPLTAGALNNTAQGSGGAFVVKYNPAGAVVYSAIIGIGSAADVATDAAGNAHVIGATRSRVFQMVNPFASSMSTGTDYIFISTLNPSGTSLSFSTLFGIGFGRQIISDASGNLYVTGYVQGYGELPLAAPLKSERASYDKDAFVAKIAATGAQSAHVKISGQVVATDGSSPAGINIKLGGSQTGLILTDAEGRYAFPVKPGGNYTVEPVRMDWNFSPRIQTFDNVTSNRQAETIYSAMNHRPTGRIVSPVEGATYTAPATVLIKADATDQDGTIQRVEFYNNDSELLFVDTEAPYEFVWNNVPANSQWAVSANLYDNTGSSGLAQWVSFVVNPSGTPTPTPAPVARHTISGQLTDQNGAPISGAFVNVLGPYSATKFSDANGGYSFAGLEAGATHTIQVYKEGYEFNPPYLTFENLSAPQTANFNGAERGSPIHIGGRIVDGSGSAAEGLRVRLETADPAAPQYRTTDANGLYRFDNVPAGVQYMVVPEDAYWTFSFEPITRSYDTAVRHVTDANFVVTRLAYFISGQVTVDGTARAGVAVTLGGGQSIIATTGSDGRYAFYDLAANTAYTVTPSLAGHTFTPASFSTTGLTNDATANFAGSAQQATTNKTNFALASNGGTATASSQLNTSFPVVAAIDGNRHSLRLADGRYNIWHSAAGVQKPDWLQVEFAGAKTIDEIKVVTQQDDYNNPIEPTEATTFQSYGLRDFEVQYWTASGWATVPGAAVTSNERVLRKFSFAPLTTTKVRVVIMRTGDGFSRVMEVEALGEAAPAPPPPQARKNMALTSNGGTATASSQYSANFPVAAAINGDRHRLTQSDGRYNMWHSAAGAQKPDWLEVSFAGTKTIDEVDVYMQQDDYNNAVDPSEAMTFTQFGLRDFEVQYWNGLQWVAVSGGVVTGNDRVWRKFTFPAITTTRVRVLVRGTTDGFTRIWEVEAWGTDTPQPAKTNVASAANGGTATASSQLNTSFPVVAAIDGNRHSLRLADGRYNIWHSAAGAQKPDWLQVEFAGAKTIDEIKVVTQQDDYNNPIEPTEATTFQSYGLRDFEVQYWTASGWATVPNATVINNDRVMRKFSFPALTTTKIRVVVTRTADGFSRIMEVEALTP